MEANKNEVAHEFQPFLRIHKDGTVERLMVFPYIPPTTDRKTGVQSKDIVISSESNLKARVCIPKTDAPNQKLPLVVHYHGGAFCVGSAFGSIWNNFISSLASKAHAIVVSIEYRLAPEHPLPIAYDDSWAAFQWIATHANGKGPDAWIKQHADFRRVFIIGESAGANIAHYVAVQAGGVSGGLELSGLIMAHPYFEGKEPDRLIKYLYPGSSGADDEPKMNPEMDPVLSKMKCSKVLVCVAEKDWMKVRGVAYYETLKKCGWEGRIEFMEHEGEDHCFYLFNPDGEKAIALMHRFASFIIHN